MQASNGTEAAAAAPPLPAAAATAAAPQQHEQNKGLQPSPAELAVLRGEAPVKEEFVRSVAARVPVSELTGPRAATPTAAAGGGAGEAAPAVATAVAGETQRDVRQKSKKQAKRDRAQQRYSSTELCTLYGLGKCTYGDTCRFNHDVAAYVRSKAADLPGSCPFTAADRCPFGVTCRWASKHARPDALTQQFVMGGAQACDGQGAGADGREAQQQQQQPPTAAQPGADAAMADAQAPAGVEQQQQEAGQQPEQQQEQQQEQGWWRRDGTIPAGAVELLASVTEPPAEPLNVLGKEAQLQLRKGQYDLGTADAVLASMGIRNARGGGRGEQQGGRGGRGGRNGRGGRGRGAQDREAAAAAAAAQAACQAAPEGQPGAAASEEGPTAGGDDAGPQAKRQRVEEGQDVATAAATTEAASAAAVQAAPPSLADAAPGGGSSDAAFVDGLWAPAASTAGAGTAPAERSGVEGRGGPREKRQVDFRGKLFLAPLTTVGNLPFRRLCKSLGADVTCGEMALGTNLLQGQPSEWALLKRHKEEDCFGVQLCGGFADTMARCAQLIEDTCQVDFVDLNFGCPIDLVCSKGAGSACLLKPLRMEQIVRSMSSVLSCPLTFKMRKGYNDGQDIAHTLVPQAAGWGAAAITLHGRTREQRYSKLADWPYIKRCVDAATPSGIQMIGNGDVFSFEDHYQHLEECPGLATTYIARGALIKPWIFTEIKERRHWDISAGERLDFFKRFCSFGLEHWGSDSRGVESTRRFLLEWLSFTHRYVPVGLLEVLPQRMHQRPPAFVGRSDLETLLASDQAEDWMAISEMLLGPAPQGFVFSPKHKANSYARREGAELAAAAAGAGPGAAAQAQAAAAEAEEEY